MLAEFRSVAFEDAEHLTGAMVAELAARYGGDGASPADGADFLPPYGMFLIGSLSGTDVACGGLRPLTAGIGEIKRMYADPAVRGQGIARALLQRLLQHGRDLGLGEIWLETGLKQPEAIALYTSEGFTPIAKYGYYKDEPLSRCFAILL